MSEAAPEAPRLRRTLRLPGLVLYGMGTTIGAGVYALMGVIAGRAGMLTPLAFALACAIAALTAASFAELSARHPRAGGEAVYVRAAFRHGGLSTGVGLLVALAGVASAATVCRAFVGTLGELVAIPAEPVLALVVLAVGVVAVWGIRESVGAAAAMTAIEIAGLLLVIGYAGDSWAALPARAHELWPAAGADWWSAAGAAMLAFYAFLGFEDMVNVAEEVRDVRRTLPLAIAATLGLTTLLYLATATACVLAVPVAELATSEAPLALVFERSGGPVGLIAGVALLAMLNGALVQMVKSSRVLYGLADLGALPRALGRVHVRTRTPVAATALTTALAGVLALWLPLESLAAFTSGITLVTFALANASLLVMKRRDAAPQGIVAVPSWVPALGFLATLGLLGVELSRVAQ